LLLQYHIAAKNSRQPDLRKAGKTDEQKGCNEYGLKISFSHTL